MEKEICKTSKRNSGEIESIGVILIPISGDQCVRISEDGLPRNSHGDLQLLKPQRTAWGSAKGMRLGTK